MNPTRPALSLSTVGVGSGTRSFQLASLVLAVASSAYADRFIVPTGDSSSDSSPGRQAPSAPPPPPTPPPPSNPPPPPPSNNDSGRFIVPTPSNTDRDNSTVGSSHGGGYNSGYGGRYAGGGHSGSHFYDPFWGGCYYWGGNYYYWGGYYYDPFHNRFGSFRESSAYRYESAAVTNQLPIFFPPSPPPLGAPIPPRQPVPASIAAPASLAAYVYEPFYAPLSTRLSQADLTKKLLQRLDAYRATRTQLQNALIQRLDSLKDADPISRASELNTLALAQAGPLRKLEAEADDLRSDLLHGGLVGLFSGTGDWNENRRWRLGEGTLAKSREETIAHEFRVIRAAAFYQDGLSLAQRRLLREVEMELQVQAFKPKTATAANPEEVLLSFSPETARLTLPADLPPALAVKIAAYEKDKSALKTELRDALYVSDSASAAKRTSTLRKLAETQSAQIATLEALAEEIRVELAQMPVSLGAPAAPAFPPELASRITAYQAEKNSLQKALQETLDDARKAKGAFSVRKKEPLDSAPLLRVDYAKNENPEALAAARKAIAAFDKDNADRLAALTKEREAIRADVARFAADKEATAGKSVETLLSDFNTSLQQGERWQHYRYYQIAVLQPGLSPEQRRLLFEVALERLTLPLPAGEYPP